MVTAGSSRARVRCPDDVRRRGSSVRRAAATSTSPGPPTRPRTNRTRVRAVRWQVFGLAGSTCGCERRPASSDLASPTGRRFPGGRIRRPVPVLGDGGRSHSPLRGSPGLAPGSLLRRPPWLGGRTSCGHRPYLGRRTGSSSYMLYRRVASSQLQNLLQALAKPMSSIPVKQVQSLWAEIPTNDSAGCARLIG